MNVHLRELAKRQADVVAAWQLANAGWDARAVEDWVRRNRWRVMHPGVYALTHASLTRRQRWMGATLSAPGTALAGASAGAC